MQKVGKFEAGGRMYRIDQEIKQKDFDDAISKLSNKKRKVNPVCSRKEVHTTKDFQQY